jgi:hypothetical protein
MLNALLSASFVLSASAGARTAPCETPAAAPMAAKFARATTYRPIKKWVDLSNAMQLDGQHYNYVHVGTQGGRFDTIRLENLSGRTYVKEVVVDFVGGGSQVIKPGETLDARNPSLTIDLAGNHRQIQRVVIAGSSSKFGSYEVLGL